MIFLIFIFFIFNKYIDYIKKKISIKIFTFYIFGKKKLNQI